MLTQVFFFFLFFFADGEIVAIAIGVVVVLGVAIFLLCYFWLYKICCKKQTPQPETKVFLSTQS